MTADVCAYCREDWLKKNATVSVVMLTTISVVIRVARFLAAKYGRLLYIRDVRQGQYLRLLLYYALTRSLQLSHSTTL